MNIQIDETVSRPHSGLPRTIVNAKTPASETTKSANSWKTFVVVSAFGTALLFPLSIEAQNHWLSACFNGQASSDVGNGTSIITDTGEVTAPDPITESGASSSTYSSVNVSAGASYGLLQFSGSCSALATSAGVGNPGYHSGSSFFNNGALGATNTAEFADKLTFSSATCAAGTPVQVLVTWIYSGSVALATSYICPLLGPGVAAADYMSLEFFPDVGPSGFYLTVDCAGEAPLDASKTGKVSQIVNTTVGGTCSMLGFILADGSVSTVCQEAGFAISSSVSAIGFSSVCVNVLTPCAYYTAESGTVYPKFWPTVKPIGPVHVGNRDFVSYYWPNTVPATGSPTNVVPFFGLQTLPVGVPLAAGAWTPFTGAVRYYNGNSQFVARDEIGAGPGMLYELAAAATNILFITPAETAPATAITNSNATLNGATTPCGFDSVYWFEYGSDTNYGLNSVTNSLITGTNLASLACQIGGLSPSNTYHFQLVVQDADGTQFGGDQQFTTLSTNYIASSLKEPNDTPNREAPFLILAGNNHAIQLRTFAAQGGLQRFYRVTSP